MQLALEQGDLEVSELLERALEKTLTRFGGPGVVDMRDLSPEMVDAFVRLDDLRRRLREG
ncbi:MAG: hypothetical protein GC191_13445 [Azospirillum sp.]|nr:hypothetical protein [Azospirillum sp.]